MTHRIDSEADVSILEKVKKINKSEMTTIMNIGPETITLLMVNSRGRQTCSGKQIPESEPTAPLVQNHNLFNANLVSKIGFVKNEYGCQKPSFTSYSYSRILVYTAFPQTMTGPLFTSSANLHLQRILSTLGFSPGLYLFMLTTFTTEVYLRKYSELATCVTLTWELRYM